MLMFCSCKCSKDRKASVWFIQYLPEVTKEFIFISSHLAALCLSFFMFCFKTNFISAIFENELEEKNMEPRLTPSHYVEEESVFGT